MARPLRLESRAGAIVSAALGIGCLMVAFTSSGAVERALGRDPGALLWGPELFRALLLFHGIALVAFGFVFWRRRAGSIGRSESAQSCTSMGVRVTVGLMCAVALALRLWHLDTDLWLDEMFTLTDFLRLPLVEISAAFPSQNQHMLYSLLSRVSVVALGESVVSIRLPAVLFGVASIWATFLLGRRIVGTREALLASALMTFSYHHVWFSQNARGYTGLLFFATLATWLWIEALERGTARRWTLYGLSVWLGIWVHMTMVFVVAAHGLVYLAALTKPGRNAQPLALDPSFRWKAPVSWFFAATLSLQVYALALPEFLTVALHEVSLDSEWINPLWVVRESLLRLADGGLSGVIVAGGILVMAAGFLSIWTRDWRAAALLSAPGLLGGGTMLALGHNLWPRFFFFCMSFVLIVALRGMTALPQWILGALKRPEAELWARRLGTTAAIAVIALSASTVPRSYLPKQDFSGAKAWIEASLQPDDVVVAVGLAGDAYSRYYAPAWPHVQNVSDLTSIEQAHSSVWLVYTLPVHLEAWLPDVWERVESEYEVVRVFPGTLGGGDVVVTRRRSGS
jgi:4-amino-4-deoxy-L-arabinose transferase-like glycosyltransferase